MQLSIGNGDELQVIAEVRDIEGAQKVAAVYLAAREAIRSKSPESWGISEQEERESKG